MCLCVWMQICVDACLHACVHAYIYVYKCNKVEHISTSSCHTSLCCKRLVLVFFTLFCLLTQTFSDHFQLDWRRILSYNKLLL